MTSSQRKAYSKLPELIKAFEQAHACVMALELPTTKMAHSSKIFNTSTIEGLKAAERFKNRLNNSCDSVEVYAIGLNRVQIVGLSRTSANRGQHPSVVPDRQ